MPAKSKSQQRLMGMIYAYDNGKFHGSKALRRRIATLAGHISAEDAEHFARTPHVGLPEKVDDSEKSEKSAQLSYQQSQQLMSMIPKDHLFSYGKRKMEEDDDEDPGILRTMLHDGVVGAALGGLITGGNGAIINGYDAHSHGLPTGSVAGAALSRGLSAGLPGVLGGLGIGAAVGGIRGLIRALRR